jgi:hypothetical protein
VPAFGADKAVAIIERDLGAPVSQLFRSFDRAPIAAASLGQVHRAVLHSGEQVVVKVQRPGLRQLFDIDLQNLKLLAEQLDRGDENRDFKGIYAECAEVGPGPLRARVAGGAGAGVAAAGGGGAWPAALPPAALPPGGPPDCCQGGALAGWAPP